MNADRLLALYDRVAEAPDAVTRLRRFVLDLAVRGKLVEQDLADEPAAKLLRRIAAEKARLRVQHHTKPLTTGEVPFRLPAGWLWSRIGELCTKTGSGSTPRGGKNVYKEVGVPFLRSQNVYDNGLRLDDVACIGPDVHARMAGTAVRARDLLLNITGGSMGRCCRVPDKFAEANVSQHVAIMRPAVSEIADFLHKLVLSPYFQAFIFDKQTGAGRGGLPKKKMDQIAVAVPPLAEQHRIVAKVDELMVLCDRLEEARTAREHTRDQLTAAGFADLTAPDVHEETFRSHARFAVDALPALTARADQVTFLRQTILSLAVRGRLVKRNEDDGEASSLMELIKAEHRQTKRRATGPDLSLVDFALPSHWSWHSLDEVIIRGPQNGISPQKTNRDDAPKSITLTATTSGSFSSNHFKNVDVNSEDAAGYWLDPDDLLFQRGNTREYVGMTAIYSGPTNEFLFPDLIMRVKVSPRMNLRFVHLWCIAPFVRFYMSSNATGAQQTMPKINQATLRATPIAVPPLAEQHRIVAKADELLALCGRLETALIACNATRSNLLEALLGEVLPPADMV